MPLTWRQVTAKLDPSRWTIRTALRRIEQHGDPALTALGMSEDAVDVEALLASLAQRLAEAKPREASG